MIASGSNESFERGSTSGTVSIYECGGALSQENQGRDIIVIDVLDSKKLS